MTVEVLEMQPASGTLGSPPGHDVTQSNAEMDECMTSVDREGDEEVMADERPSGDQDPPVLATAVVLDTSTSTEDNDDVFTPLLKATKIGLDSRNITYNVHPQNEDGVTTITFEANLMFARGVPFRILIKESSGLFILMLHMPTLVPEEHRTIVSKYWTRVNYNLNVGNFEMDLRDGEVRFRVATVIKNTHLSPEMVGDAVDTAAGTVRQYLRGQFYVIYGDMDVEKAYQTARNY